MVPYVGNMFRGESGQNTIEYGLLAVLLALAAILLLILLGPGISDGYHTITNTLLTLDPGSTSHIGHVHPPHPISPHACPTPTNDQFCLP